MSGNAADTTGNITMKLLELYSLSTGLRIGKQYLMESFYPLEFENYITFQSGSGMASKNYPFYNEVMALISTTLKSAGIEAIQIGGKDDPPIQGCYHQQGNTNLHQSNYLLGRSLCHIGNDSWASHRGGEIGVPLVICFGPTTPQNHGPYHYDHARSVFIESHRLGRRPTFANQENPTTIALIPPEQIANSILSILKIGPLIERSSIYIGDAYNQPVVEIVPNIILNPQIQISGPLIIRMDHLHNEDMLWGNLQLRKSVIAIDQEINLNMLTQLKPNVISLRVEVDKLSSTWIKQLKRLGIPTAFFSSESSAEKLAKLRLDLHSTILFDKFQPPTKDEFLKLSARYLNKEIDKDLKIDKLKFSTNKMLLSESKVYLSKAHWLAGKDTSVNNNSGQVIDTPEFWEEAPHFYIYTQ